MNAYQIVSVSHKHGDQRISVRACHRVGVGCSGFAAQSDALRVCGDAVTPARQESTDETRPPLAFERAQNFQALSDPLTTWPGTAERLVFTPPQRFARLSAREIRVPEALLKRRGVDVPGKRGFVPAIPKEAS